jgi:hypothetical protein
MTRNVLPGEMAAGSGAPIVTNVSEDDALENTTDPEKVFWSVHVLGEFKMLDLELVISS